MATDLSLIPPDDAACRQLQQTLQLHRFYTPKIVPAVGSTNRDVMAMAAADAPEGTLLVALEQKQGRGRQGRVWHSPVGNLYMSLLLRPNCSLAKMGELSFVVACALSAALRNIHPDLDVQHKWPNDILVNQAKISGILLESGPLSTAPWLVAGMGVNIQSAPADTPYAVTTLREQCQKLGVDRGKASPTVADMLNAFTDSFYRLYRQWQKAGFAPVRELWLARAYRLQETVTVKLGKHNLEGIFQDLDGDGALILSDSEGQIHRITAGELFFPNMPAAMPNVEGDEYASRH